MDSLNVIEIPSLFQGKTIKRLSFKAEGLTIEKPLSFDQPVFIASENINAFRYGVKFLRGYRFYIGRIYFIELKDVQNNVFRIKLKSYYGIKRDMYYKLWGDTMDRLWQNYFGSVLNYYVELYKMKQSFKLLAVDFLTEGISWEKGKILFWENIALSNYVTYFMIHHKEVLSERKSYNFANDWNALILQKLLKQVVAEYK